MDITGKVHCFFEQEEWRDIKGYEGKYQVSNLGNVKSLQYKRLGKARILIPYISNRGYYTVALSMNSKKAVRTIHRLVAETFVENIDDLPMVNHVDGNKKNNRADNLEWCTQKHNIEHAWESGLAKKDNNRVIYQFDLGMNFIKKYKSQTEASKETGIKQSEISKCCNGLRNKAGDYIWCYDDRLLSELESYKGKIILSDEEYNKVIDNAQKDIKSELETYKKIAEKLAELLLKGNEVPYICDLIIVEHCNKYKSGECGKCIIDWARKEVLKDE